MSRTYWTSNVNCHRGLRAWRGPKAIIGCSVYSWMWRWRHLFYSEQFGFRVTSNFLKIHDTIILQPDTFFQNLDVPKKFMMNCIDCSVYSLDRIKYYQTELDETIKINSRSLATVHDKKSNFDIYREPRSVTKSRHRHDSWHNSWSHSITVTGLVTKWQIKMEIAAALLDSCGF